MSWPKIVTPGTVTIFPDGMVVVNEDFEVENCSCREAVQLGIAWAMERLGAALVENMTADEPKLSARG